MSSNSDSRAATLKRKVNALNRVSKYVRPTGTVGTVAASSNNQNQNSNSSNVIPLRLNFNNDSSISNNENENQNQNENENQNENNENADAALIIGDKRFTHISGPISFYVLEPNPSELYRDVHRPPILLFGDYHGSIANRCINCSYANGCAYIGDPSVYEALDQLATRERPVDIYEEQNFAFPLIMKDISSAAKDRRAMPMQDAIDIATTCTAYEPTTGMRQRLDACPTENIRYQLMDARFAYMHGRMTFEAMLTYRSQYKKHIPEFEKIYQVIVALRANPEAYVKEIIRVIHYFGPKRSILAKEMTRLPAGVNGDEMVRAAIRASIQILGPKSFDNYRSWIMDAYTLLRLFKKPTEEGVRPSLVWMYYGHAHVLGLLRCFVLAFGYRMTYRSNMDIYNNADVDPTVARPIKSEDKVERCTEIERDINLQDMIDRAEEVNRWSSRSLRPVSQASHVDLRNNQDIIYERMYGRKDISRDVSRGGNRRGSDSCRVDNSRGGSRGHRRSSARRSSTRRGSRRGRGDTKRKMRSQKHRAAKVTR